MPEDHSTIRQIAWQDVFPGTLLFNTLRLAVNFRALLLAAVGFVAMTGGWWLIGKAFPTDEHSKLGQLKGVFNDLVPWSGNPGSANFKHGPGASALDDDPDLKSSPLALTDQAVPEPAQASPDFGAWVSFSPLVQAWNLLTMPFVQLLNLNWTFTPFVYALVCALWSLAVWAFFGGAIARMAAVALAREEQLSFGQAVSFACRKWASYFTAPLFPLLGVVLMSLPLALFGLLLRFNAGVVIAGVLWPLVLLDGLCMAVLMVGLFFGWPLMWATISTEGTDSFDALSRSYAYTYQRPLHYLLYAVVAALLGGLGLLIVTIFVGQVINLSNWGVSWGSSSEQIKNVLNPLPGSAVSPTGSALVNFWIRCVETVALGFMFSYLWTASTAIYLLLRRRVDAIETDEVYMPEQDELYGLPPLKEDAAGVPGPADDATVAGNGGAA